MQRKLNTWLIIVYGFLALCAMCIIISVPLLREESSNGFENALNSLFDTIFQVSVVFYYLVFVLLSSFVGFLIGHFKQENFIKKSFKPYLIGSLSGIILFYISTNFF